MSQNFAVIQADRNPKSRENGEGTTYFDHRRNRWVSQTYNIYGKREFASFVREEEANKWRLERNSERELGIGSKSESKKLSVQQLLDRWLTTRKDRIRPATYRFYDITIRNRINPYLGNIKIRKLNPEMIELAMDKPKSQGYSAGSIRSVYATLSKAFSDSVRLGLMPYNPLDRVERLKIDSIPSEPISKEDTKRLIQTAQTNHRDMARLIVGISLGLRPGEVAGLRWEDFDLDNRKLQVQRQVQYIKEKGYIYCSPKTTRRKAIPLLENEVTILKVYKESLKFERVLWMSKSINGHPVWKGDPEIVFPNKHGNLQNPKSDRNWFRDLCLRAGVPQYQLYQMRKRAFTDLLMVTNIATVMEYSGHTQATTLLNHYILPDTDDIRRAIETREKESSYFSNTQGSEE